jgi:hypothetical protein
VYEAARHRAFLLARDHGVMKRTLVLVLAAALALPAGANVLYKSVDETGTVTFSDTPPPASSRLVEERSINSPSSPGPGYSSEAFGATGGLEAAFQMLDYDKALREANERVDMAEHALAQARSNHAPTPRPGLNAVGGIPAADADRIEFHKRDLRMARIALADVLRSRSLASGRAIK